VVAIAKRVAYLKGCSDLGGDSDIGYHVGNHNLSTNQTKLLFITAGILLEELRNNGIEALTKYKCVIIDECHERSPESDLVLTLAKRLMKTHPRDRFRLVLMSATFNHKRYTSYFKDVPGCSTIDTITLETAASFDAWHSQVQTFYLNDIPIPERILAPHKNFLQNMRRDPFADLRSDGGKSLSDAMLEFIKTLVSYLDDEEPKSAPFLIFVPTYRHLEQLFRTLVSVNRGMLTLSVLHSAIDIEDCMRTLASASRDRGRRHVLLASAIADSSVTVPGITCVIDLCRSLEVRWNVSKRSYDAKTAWCSKSIADQRKGRTGRTCPGRVFRLVHHGFYIQALEQWDIPQLSMSSCHNEVLSMVCADGRLGLNDPRKFFNECLDPPAFDALEDAIQYLIDLGACHEIEQTSLFHSRHSVPLRNVVPSDYGAMISALPMSVTDAQLVVEGGRIGLLHETLALVAIMNHRPAPITHRFGANELNHVFLEEYYPQVASTNKQSMALANLSAYLYWDAHWLREYEKKQLAMFLTDTKRSDAWAWSEKDDDDNIEWCKQHNLNPSSMRSIKEIIENTMSALYLGKHEPEWLRCSSANPIWKEVKAAKVESSYFERDMLSRIYGDEKVFTLCEALTKLTFNRSADLALPFAQAYFGLPSTKTTGRNKTRTRAKENMACVHFLMGNCKFGNKCQNVHSFSAPRPLCRFHPNCSKGSSCVYSHGDPSFVKEAKNVSTRKSSKPIVPVLEKLSLEWGVLGWFVIHHKHSVLLGEGNFEFSNSLVDLRLPPLLATTDVLNRLPSGRDPVVNARSRAGVDATRLHTNVDLMTTIATTGSSPINIVWNFPFITDEDENATAHEILIRDTFQSVKLLFEVILPIIPMHGNFFCLGLQGDQLSRWNVLKSAWAVGWKLHAWDKFCYSDFPGYVPRRLNGEAFPVGSTRFYVFKYDKQ
jgi:HrpA-like RNA helicase